MSFQRLFGALALGAVSALPALAHADSTTSAPSSNVPGEQTILPAPSFKVPQDAAPRPDLNGSGAKPDVATVDRAAPMTFHTILTTTTPAGALYLDEATTEAATEAPNIHGFAEAPFRSAYITPRGLVVENQGLVFQPVAGLILPVGDFGPLKKFTLISGIWNSINTNQSNHFIGAWNEMDYFATISTNVGDNLNFSLTYGAWNFPTGGVVTEHNLDLKISYDDSKMWGESGFGIHPYVDIWWAISGGSTVVLGRPGGTGYIELGAVPTYTLKISDAYPITLTAPTYVSVGPKNYWSYGPNTVFGTGNVGVFSTAVNASMPLAFIPGRYGSWHVDAGITYLNIINGTLREAGTILSGNKDPNVFIAEVGFGVNF